MKDYLIQVVAVDGGAGWGEFEGRAIVEAKPIYYHSRPFMQPPPPPDPLDEFPKECKYDEVIRHTQLLLPLTLNLAFRSFEP